MSRIDSRLSVVQVFAFFMAVLVCVSLSIGFAISIYSQAGKDSAASLDVKINPNVATAASLSRLPGVGVVRAAEIVACRENLRVEEGGVRAFEVPDDLQKVKGIGPKTVKKISQWLKF